MFQKYLYSQKVHYKILLIVCTKINIVNSHFIYKSNNKLAAGLLK